MNEYDQLVFKDVITAGLELNAVYGAARAWVYLSHNHVPHDVIAVVLGEAARQQVSKQQPTEIVNPMLQDRYTFEPEDE